MDKSSTSSKSEQKKGPELGTDEVATKFAAAVARATRALKILVEDKDPDNYMYPLNNRWEIRKRIPRTFSMATELTYTAMLPELRQGERVQPQISILDAYQFHVTAIGDKWTQRDSDLVDVDYTTKNIFINRAALLELVEEDWLSVIFEVSRRLSAPTENRGWITTGAAYEAAYTLFRDDKTMSGGFNSALINDNFERPNIQGWYEGQYASTDPLCVITIASGFLMPIAERRCSYQFQTDQLGNSLRRNLFVGAILVRTEPTFEFNFHFRIRPEGYYSFRFGGTRVAQALRFTRTDSAGTVVLGSKDLTVDDYLRPTFMMRNHQAWAGNISISSAQGTIAEDLQLDRAGAVSMEFSGVKIDQLEVR